MKMKVFQVITVIVILLCCGLFFNTNDELRTCVGGGYNFNCFNTFQPTLWWSLVVGVGLAIASTYTAFTRKGFFSRSVSNPATQPISIFSQPASPSVSGTTTASVEDQLQKASDMLKKGLIDEEEYKALKRKIIEKV